MPIDRVDIAGTLVLVLLVVFAGVWVGIAAYPPATMGVLISAVLFAAVIAALIRRRSSAASYVVTNYRVLVQTPKGIEGIPLEQLAQPTVFDERRDGTGNISFGPPNRIKQAYTALIRGADTPHPAMHLLQIEQAREVADKLKAAQQRRRR